MNRKQIKRVINSGIDEQGTPDTPHFAPSFESMLTLGLTLRLLTMLAVEPPVDAGGTALMLKKIVTDMKLINHPVGQLNRLFKNTLPHFHCVQVETDESLFALSFLEYLHESDEIPPLVNGGKWQDCMGCTGFILLAANYSSSRTLLARTPRYAEHRIILIIKGAPTVALNDVLMGGAEIYRDADVVLLASRDMSSGYYMAQPKRYFTRFSRPKKWVTIRKGPYDFGGREIRVLTSNCTIFSKTLYINESGIPRRYTGVEIEMFEDIAMRLNLKPKYKREIIKESLWFKNSLMDRSENGSDIAFCGILMSAKKMTKFIAMSVPETQLCLKYLVPRPVPVNREWDGVFRPFDPQLWFIIALILFSTSFFLQRLSWVSVKYTQTTELQKYEGLGGSFVQLLSILVMANVPKSSTKQGSVRHLLTWWALFSMILTTCFSSGLISHLTQQTFTRKPNTIEELVKKKYTWTMEAIPDFSELFNLREQWQVQWKYRFHKIKSHKEHMKLLKEGKQALLGYYAFGGFALADNDLPEATLSNYEAVNNCFMEYFVGFALRQGSPFEGPINKYIQAYVEGGLIEALFRQGHHKRYIWRYKYVYQVLHPTKGKFAGPDDLELEHLTGIFIVWSVGIVLSTLVFLLEIAQKFWI